MSISISLYILWSPKEVLELLTVKAENGFLTALQEFKQHYATFSKVSGGTDE